MKSWKYMLSFLITLVLLVSSSVSAFAMNFVAEDIYNSVFVVYSGDSLGSGFAIGKKCIVTNAHVIEDIGDIQIESYSGKKYKAEVIGIDSQQDIAVLDVLDETFPPIRIASISDVATGDDVYTIGAPKSMAYTLTKGVISSKNRIANEQTYLQIDAPINSGNSGGPLLNESGLVIGIISMKLENSEGIGLAIPIDRVCKYIDELGYDIDDNGEITGNVKNLYPNNDKSNKNTEKKPIAKAKTNKLMMVALIFSVILNIVFSILLIYQRKKNINLQYDPRDRTDFDIEILE